MQDDLFGIQQTTKLRAGRYLALGKLQAGIQAAGAWDDDALRAWMGVDADLALVLDEDGVILGLGCRTLDLWRELHGGRDWLGQPWAATATVATRTAVDTLLRNASAEEFLKWQHVDHATTDGRTTPMLCSATRVGPHIVAYGRDLRAMDFVRLLMEHEAAAACACAKAMHRGGLGLETIRLDVLAPAARRLGDLWMEDACTFTDVMVGLGRLHKVLHSLELAGPLEVPPLKEERRILLTACPGEQHTFGIAVVAAFFREAGWHVYHDNAASDADLGQMVRRNWFAVVGFSICAEDQLTALAARIRRVRRASCNTAIRIMVGGKIFTDQPELAAQVGADATAFDGRHAVHQAQRILVGAKTQDGPDPR